MSVCRHEQGTPSKPTITERGSRGIFQSRRFVFGLFEHDVDDDILTYTLTYGELCTRLIVCGIDSVEPCGPDSDVDFVHFVWKNTRQPCFKRHSVTLLPLLTTGPTILAPSSAVPRRSTSPIKRPRAMGGAFTP